MLREEGMKRKGGPFVCIHGLHHMIVLGSNAYHTRSHPLHRNDGRNLLVVRMIALYTTTSCPMVPHTTTHGGTIPGRSGCTPRPTSIVLLPSCLSCLSCLPSRPAGNLDRGLAFSCLCRLQRRVHCDRVSLAFLPALLALTG